jgi:hypothetical protein
MVEAPRSRDVHVLRALFAWSLGPEMEVLRTTSGPSLHPLYIMMQWVCRWCNVLPLRVRRAPGPCAPLSCTCVRMIQWACGLPPNTIMVPYLWIYLVQGNHTVSGRIHRYGVCAPNTRSACSPALKDDPQDGVPIHHGHYIPLHGDYSVPRMV